MSLKAMVWAWDMGVEYDLSPPELLTLLKLADWANEEGLNCFPSYGKLAEKSRQGHSTVRKSVTALEEKGLLRVTERRRADGTRSSNEFILAVQNSSKKALLPQSTQGEATATTEQVPALSEQTTAPTEQGGCSDVAGISSQSIQPEKPANYPLAPSGNAFAAGEGNHPAAPDGKTKVEKPLFVESPEELRLLWDDMADDAGLAWMKLSGSIHKKHLPDFIARIAEIPERDRWETIIERVLANDFLLGGNKDGKVILSLPWLVKSDHASLAEAGHYGMGKPRPRENTDDAIVVSDLSGEETKSLTPEMTKAQRELEQRRAAEAAELVEGF